MVDADMVSCCLHALVLSIDLFVADLIVGISDWSYIADADADPRIDSNFRKILE